MAEVAEERRQRTTELLERMGMNPTTTLPPPPPSAPTSNSSQSPQQPPPPQPEEIPYYQRLYNDHVRHQQRIQQARDDIAAEEAAHAPSFSPHLNPTKDVERVLPGEGDLSQRLETWRKRRNERRVEAQNQIVREQESLMRETPEINAYSHELADELIADGKRHPDVSEHLYSLAPDFDKKVEWMKAQQMAAEVPATPAITRMAMSLEREGPVGDRLYEAALETRAKLLKQRQESSKKDNYNAARGHPSPIVVQKQRSKVIGHNLYDLAVKQRKKKDSMRKKKQLAIEQKQNIKHITKTVREGGRRRKGGRRKGRRRRIVGYIVLRPTRLLSLLSDHVLFFIPNFFSPFFVMDPLVFCSPPLLPSRSNWWKDVKNPWYVWHK